MPDLLCDHIPHNFPEDSSTRLWARYHDCRCSDSVALSHRSSHAYYCHNTRGKSQTHVLVDNMSVVHNTSRLESTLKKKSNSIVYHFMRESAAASEIQISHVESKENISDMLTKIQTGPERKRLAQMVLY